MAPPAGNADRRKVEIYANTLGGALRAAGRREFGSTFDAVPLTVAVSVPSRVAKELEGGGLLLQKVVPPVAMEVRKIVLRDIAPFLTPGVPANTGPIETALRLRRRDIELPIEAAIENHFGMAADWKAYRDERLKEGAIVAVTLSLSVAAMGIVPFEPGLSGAAAIIGLTRGIIDGALELKTCWITASEAMVEADVMIARLNRRHDGGGASGAAASQIAGAVGRGTSLTKLGALAGRDPLPSIDAIDKRLTVAEGKIGHLYVFLDRMTKRLSELLRRQSELEGIDPVRAGKAEARIAALLETQVSGRRHGFRGKYTIADGFRQCTESRRLLTAHRGALARLAKRDPNAARTAAAVGRTEAFVNVGMSAINYEKLFADNGGGARAIFGLDEGQTAAVAASFGLFNDAVGLLKELAGVAPGGSSEGGNPTRREVRLDFATAPSGLVTAGRP